MSGQVSRDLSGKVPADAAQQQFPGFIDAHTHHAASGLTASAYRLSIAEPFEFNGHDSQERLHFTIWLQGAVNAHSAEHRLYLQSGDCISAIQPGVDWTMRCQPGAMHNLGLFIMPTDLIQMAGGAGAQYLEQLQRQDSLLHQACQAPALRAAGELDACLRNAGCSTLMREAKSMELLAWLLQGLGGTKNLGLTAYQKKRLLQARDMLLANPTHAPSITELAQDCGLNSFAFKRGFRLLFGTSAHALHQQERMRLAWRLIESGEMNVSEAGEHVGYTSLSHFSTAFRKEFGMLPSALKRRAALPTQD